MKTAHHYYWIVAVHYDGPYGEQGKVLSRHEKYSNAEKAAKKYGNWARIYPATEAE